MNMRSCRPLHFYIKTNQKIQNDNIHANRIYKSRYLYFLSRCIYIYSCQNMIYKDALRKNMQRQNLSTLCAS